MYPVKMAIRCPAQLSETLLQHQTQHFTTHRPNCKPIIHLDTSNSWSMSVKEPPQHNCNWQFQHSSPQHNQQFQMFITQNWTTTTQLQLAFPNVHHRNTISSSQCSSPKTHLLQTLHLMQKANLPHALKQTKTIQLLQQRHPCVFYCETI